MFQAWPKIPRLENEVYHISEKIDGTNACIIIHYEYEASPCGFAEVEVGLNAWGFPSYLYVSAQSRSRLITPEEDNYGFAKWVKENAEQLVADLGVGYHYGEWWGKGVNRGYGLDHKRFSLFNPTKSSSICYNVPILGVSNASCLQPTIEEFKDKLMLEGSLASPGYMKPEGMVVYAEKAKQYWKVIMDK